MEVSAMPWWTAQYDRYGVALGVQQGLDAWDVGTRLHPQIIASSTALPYVDDETLVGLSDFRTDAGDMPVPLDQPRLFEPAERRHEHDCEMGGRTGAARL